MSKAGNENIIPHKAIESIVFEVPLMNATTPVVALK
jgi:hypothetical protein